MVVAFSGGLDSSVLLHALSEVKSHRPHKALHVNHNLQPAAACWPDHCAKFCRELDIEFENLDVAVDTDSGRSLEEAARDARYQALIGALKPGDCLLLAQHADDQAETVLLQLLRGAGSRGLSAMPAVRELADGALLRPLLSWQKVELRDYASACGLHWIEDPHNSDTEFDRVYLREKVLPVIAARWPAAAQSFSQSAAQLAEDNTLLMTQARADLRRLTDAAGRLGLSPLLTLSPARRRAVMRAWLIAAGFVTPSRSKLDAFLGSLLSARKDLRAEVVLSDCLIRHYDGRLYLLKEEPVPLPESALPPLRAHESLALGEGLGCLQLEPSAGDMPDYPRPLTIRWRSGGEKIQLQAGEGRRAVKELLRDARVVPWMRECIPLLYDGDLLVAVADLWSAAPHSSLDQPRVRWVNRPALY